MPSRARGTATLGPLWSSLCAETVSWAHEVGEWVRFPRRLERWPQPLLCSPLDHLVSWQQLREPSRQPCTLAAAAPVTRVNAAQGCGDGGRGSRTRTQADSRSRGASPRSQAGVGEVGAGPEPHKPVRQGKRGRPPRQRSRAGKAEEGRESEGRGRNPISQSPCGRACTPACTCGRGPVAIDLL